MSEVIQLIQRTEIRAEVSFISGSLFVIGTSSLYCLHFWSVSKVRNSVYQKAPLSLHVKFSLECLISSSYNISSIPQQASNNSSNVTGLARDAGKLETWFVPPNSVSSCLFSLEEHGKPAVSTEEPFKSLQTIHLPYSSN